MSQSPHSDTLTPSAAPEPIPRLLRDLVNERTGVFFDDERLIQLMEKLEPRARSLGSPSYLDYYYKLKYDEAPGDEWKLVMDALSVQETYFWRELDQIRVLAEHIVPEWFRTTPLPFRIWSAACASGEEPYSIAIALREAGWGHHPIEIIASDSSEAALAKARKAIYRERSFRALPLHLRQKYFSPHPEGQALLQDIVERVSFRWANLMTLHQNPDPATVNVVFCRNVFIYFSADAIRHVVADFAKRVPLGGHLFVGSSESLIKVTNQFDLREMHGAFGYVRQDSP